jgi:hypothetical protein
VSKKKTRAELIDPGPFGETPAGAEDAPGAPAVEEPPSELAALESPAPAPDPAPLAPPEPAPEVPAIDLVMAPPAPAEPPPLAIPAPELSETSLLERIRRLEEALAAVQNLHGIEQRVAERVATQLQREKPVAATPEPEGLSGTAALLDAGKRLLPAFMKPSAASTSGQPSANASPTGNRWWLVWDIIAEARVIVRMYLDPRYSLSWMGRTLPLILLAAFLTAQWWVPFNSLPIFGWIFVKVVELLTGFLLFKVLGHEARRYRETAPDLPPSLRL